MECVIIVGLIGLLSFAGFKVFGSNVNAAIRGQAGGIATLGSGEDHRGGDAVAAPGAGSPSTAAAPASPPPPPLWTVGGNPAISGHGTYDHANGTFTVPPGTSILMPTFHNQPITNSYGNAIETGSPINPNDAWGQHLYGAGSEMPNYTLHPPGTLNILPHPTLGAPLTVTTPTNLSDILQANQGCRLWAACMVNPRLGKSPMNPPFESHRISRLSEQREADPDEGEYGAQPDALDRRARRPGGLRHSGPALQRQVAFLQGSPFPSPRTSHSTVESDGGTAAVKALTNAGYAKEDTSSNRGRSVRALASGVATLTLSFATLACSGRAAGGAPQEGAARGAFTDAASPSLSLGAATSPEGRASADGPPAPADVGAPPADADRAPDGLVSKVLIAGTDAVHPGINDVVTVTFASWTSEGSSFHHAEAVSVTLASSIPGWAEALRMMVVGERRRVWIPASLAYEGAPGTPAGMLVCDIALLDIRRGPTAPLFVSAPPADATRTRDGLASKVLVRGRGNIHPRRSDGVRARFTAWHRDGRLEDESGPEPVTRPSPRTSPGSRRVWRRWSSGRRARSGFRRRSGRAWTPIRPRRRPRT